MYFQATHIGVSVSVQSLSWKYFFPLFLPLTSQFSFSCCFQGIYDVLLSSHFLVQVILRDLGDFIFLCTEQIFLSVSITFPKSPILNLNPLIADSWSGGSQSRLLDTTLVTKDGTEERPQTHPERRHSQCRVRGSSQQVHPAPSGGRSWGQPQQVQVSRINSLQWSEDELSFHGTGWAQKANRQSIHMTEGQRRINEPFTSQRRIT